MPMGSVNTSWCSKCTYVY